MSRTGTIKNIHYKKNGKKKRPYAEAIQNKKPSGKENRKQNIRTTLSPIRELKIQGIHQRTEILPHVKPPFCILPDMEALIDLAIIATAMIIIAIKTWDAWKTGDERIFNSTLNKNIAIIIAAMAICAIISFIATILEKMPEPKSTTIKAIMQAIAK